MFDKGQKQEAGNNAFQVQGQNIIINNGITEERARAIYQEQNQIARKEYTDEANKIAEERFQKFENRLMERFMQLKNTLSSFADPAFQILLRHAQLSAAATERDADYDLLTELLIYHIQKGKDRNYRAPIKKAIEIIGDIDNNALSALTVYYLLNYMRPQSGDIDIGINILETLFRDIIDTDLPFGDEWIEHLGILNTIRISSLYNGDKTFLQTMSKFLNGYACVGIPQNSQYYIYAINLLDSVGIDHNILMPNILINGYYRLPIIEGNKYDIYLCRELGRIKESALTNEQIQALNTIKEMYTNDSSLQKKVNSELIKKWDSFPILKKIHDWWDQIPLDFYINIIGEIIALTNARRFRPDIPNKFAKKATLKYTII